jgi:hypothetical protein
MTAKRNVALEKFTVAQIATAISTLTGETVSPKAFNYKGKALGRLKALMKERHLSVQDVLRAAGIEAVTPEGETISGIGIAPAPSPAKPESKPRDSKQAQMIEMLKRPEGASIAEIVKAFGWQAHTVRGAISGALKKKLGLAVTSGKVDGRGRVYAIRVEG